MGALGGSTRKSDFIRLSVKGSWRVLSMGSKGPKKPFRMFQCICPLFLILQMTKESRLDYRSGGSVLGRQQESSLPPKVTKPF